MSSKHFPQRLVGRGNLRNETPPTASVQRSLPAPDPLVFREHLSFGHQCWKAWFTALTLRQKEKHKVDDAPSEAIVKDLNGRFERDPVAATKYVKSQTIFLVAKILGQPDDELPIVPLTGDARPGVLGGGWVYRLCRRLMNNPVSSSDSPAVRKRKLSRAMDLLESKTGRPAVTEAFVEDAMRKYMKDMTDPQEVPIPPADWREDTRFELVMKFRTFATELVGKVFRGRIFWPRDTIPSLNSCYEAPRKEGGCFGALIRSSNLEPDDSDREVQVPSEWRSSAPLSAPMRTITCPGLDLLRPFEKAVDRQILAILERGYADCKPFPIKEPDKVRVITMQNAALSTRALELQKFLHQIVGEIPACRCIKEPLTDAIVDEHFGKRDDSRPLYMSGDYEGATNNLHSWVSEHLWNEICRNVVVQRGSREDGTPVYVTLRETEWYAIGLVDLTRHMIERTKDGRTVRALQQTGQMMGSPTSFPLLCLANLCASSVGLGSSVDEALSVSPLLVNGDDIAARTDKVGYRRWERSTAAVGLKKSLGKNYVSDAFLLMNSEMRTWVREGQTLHWVRVSAINQALLNGTERKGVEAGSDLKPRMNWQELGERARELVRDALPSEGERILGRFMANHAEVLKKVPAVSSYWITEQLGGVGLPDLKGRTIPVENLQFATSVSLLAPLERSKLVAAPKQTRRGQLDVFLSDSERHYADLFPTHVNERTGWEDLLQWRGVQLERESSDIGSQLRLGYAIRRALEADGPLNETGVNHRWATQVSQQAAKFGRLAGKAKSLIFPFNDPEKKGDKPPSTPEEEQILAAHRAGTRQGFFLMRQETARAWIPTSYLVVEYPCVGETVLRQGYAYERARRGRGRVPASPGPRPLVFGPRNRPLRIEQPAEDYPDLFGSKP